MSHKEITKKIELAMQRDVQKDSVKSISLFGSNLRDEQKEESDVDLLVEFKDNQKPGMFGFIKMQKNLSDVLGKKVDLVTRDQLSKYFRDQVINNSKKIYEAR